MSAAPLGFGSDSLLDAVGKLPPDELNAFVEQVIRLRAQTIAPSLGCRESELMQLINAGLPSPEAARYQELKERRDAELLTPREHAELLELSDRIEELNADRIAALAELAQLRGVSLRQLMDQLEIPAVSHE
ncbi:MAG TPA: hypothetical protein VMP01_27405 [Pirellulaceae bacterium]|nr:hypothetical protein [Pirellulaceae bacterium]